MKFTVELTLEKDYGPDQPVDKVREALLDKLFILDFTVTVDRGDDDDESRYSVTDERIVGEGVTAWRARLRPSP